MLKSAGIKCHEYDFSEGGGYELSGERFRTAEDAIARYITRLRGVLKQALESDGSKWPKFGLHWTIEAALILDGDMPPANLAGDELWFRYQAHFQGKSRAV